MPRVTRIKRDEGVGEGSPSVDIFKEPNEDDEGKVPLDYERLYIENITLRKKVKALEGNANSLEGLRDEYEARIRELTQKYEALIAKTTGEIDSLLNAIGLQYYDRKHLIAIRKVLTGKILASATNVQEENQMKEMQGALDE